MTAGWPQPARVRRELDFPSVALVVVSPRCRHDKGTSNSEKNRITCLISIGTLMFRTQRESRHLGPAEPKSAQGQLVDPAGPEGRTSPRGPSPRGWGGDGQLVDPHRGVKSARAASDRGPPGPPPRAEGGGGPGGRRVRRRARAADAPPAPHGPPGKGADGAGPAASTPRPLGPLPAPPFPPSQPVGEAHGGVGRRRGAPRTGWRREGRPPFPLVPPLSPGGTAASTPNDRRVPGPGRTCAPRPAAAPIARTAAVQPTERGPWTPPAGRGKSGERGGGKEGRKEGKKRTPSPPPGLRRRGGGGASDKPLCRGLTFNRSQRGSCSATYETPTQKQVVYEWFSTRFPTNVRCVTGEGAAAFPAAPRVPGRRALRTGPRSRRAAGRAAPRPGGRGRRPAGGDGGGPAIRGQPRLPRRCRIVPPGRDSDLEAFSHNPTDGSFAPLAPQPSTYTKCLNLRFLSY